MRTAFQFALAVMVSAVSFSSCTKNLIQDNGSDPAAPVTEGTRTIAVSFVPQTKTALGKDGLTPEFLGGEKIKIALKDGLAAPEEKEVVIENGIAVIHTDLEGELDAVYPASAAKVEDNKITGISVYSTQTGKFADANICSATILAGSQSATFKNETAILKFYVDKSIDVKSITIAGKENVADNSSSIKIDGTDENSILSEITKGTSNERICYVAVLAGSHSALQFTSETSTQSAPVQKQLQPETLLPGTMYNVFLPYYIQVGDQKWGYCNVGAFLPEEYGDFFVWGGTEGHRAKPSTASFEDSFSFHKGSFPENLDNGCSSYISQVCQNDILLPAYDAANVVWKGNWRMPTQEEAKQLVNLGSQYVDGKFKGWKISNTELFLPATGYGINDYISYPGEAARYWTSSFKDSNLMYAWTLILFDTQPADVNVHEIYWGCPIRPIYAPTPGSTEDDIPDGALKGVFTVSDGGTPDNTSDDITVRFSQGNLSYTVNTKQWSFYEHQYDCATGYDANLISLFTWGYNENTSVDPDGEGYVTGHTEDGESFSASEDWGSQIGDGKTWRTLTTAEWQYLFNTRATSTNTGTNNARYAKATVGSISGIILLPDKYEHPSGVAALTNINTSDAGYTANNYDVSTWAAMEDAGAVFLPSAGYREGSDVDFDNNYGAYWSSTAFDDECAYCVDFASPLYHPAEDFYFIPDDFGYRDDGCSVRLVTNVSAAPAPGSTVDDLTVRPDDSDKWQK